MLGNFMHRGEYAGMKHEPCMAEGVRFELTKRFDNKGFEEMH